MADFVFPSADEFTQQLSYGTGVVSSSYNPAWDFLADDLLNFRLLEPSLQPPQSVQHQNNGGAWDPLLLMSNPPTALPELMHRVINDAGPTEPRWNFDSEEQDTSAPRVGHDPPAGHQASTFSQPVHLSPRIVPSHSLPCPSRISPLRSLSRSPPPSPPSFPRVPSPSCSPRPSSPVSRIIQLTIESNDSSWAARNPARPVLSTRPVVCRHLTEAQKASRSLAREQTRVKRQELEADIKTFEQEQKLKITELANKHHVSNEKIQDLVGTRSQYKKPRKPNLHNAILHAKALEVNEDVPVGEKKKLAELKSLVATDEKLQDLTEEQEQALINALVEYREHRSTSVRANNAAAARDVLMTTEALCKEIDNLALRTGVYVSLFLTRGHINDTWDPSWYGNDNSMDFWEEVYHLQPDEICRQYEQWACVKHQNTSERDSLENVRKQCTKYAQSGLCIITNNRKLKMNYVNYERAIVQAYGVKILGWPPGIPMVNPSAIGVVADIRRLRDAWKSGECHWIKLSNAQLHAHTEELDRRREEGEVIGKPRKKRSDAGTSRKRKSRSGKENQPAAKARRVAGSCKQKKSAEVVDSSSSEGEED